MFNCSELLETDKTTGQKKNQRFNCFFVRRGGLKTAGSSNNCNMLLSLKSLTDLPLDTVFNKVIQPVPKSLQ